jgi:hypothetical protein
MCVLAYAMNNTALLICYAKAGIKLIFRPIFNYQKCGINLLELILAYGYQQGFLEKAEWHYNQKTKALMQTINRLSAKGKAH